MEKNFVFTQKNTIANENIYANSATTIGWQELAEDISNNCALSVHEIEAILSAFEECVWERLMGNDKRGTFNVESLKLNEERGGGFEVLKF